MTNVPQTTSSIIPELSRSTLPESQHSRRLSRALAETRGQMIARTANVMAEGAVARQKLMEIDQLAREAVTGQIMLAKWVETLAGSNAFMHEEVRLFTDIARMSKAQIMADLTDTFCEERRLG